MSALLRSSLLLGLLAVSAVILACAWDRDTLAEETRGKMDVLGALTGRFERNPALYYEMRLERVQKELESSPGELDLYDDAAVAADRLGKHELATEIIEKKRKRLPELEKDSPQAVKDAWYRYHANAGTFIAHGWVKGDRKDKRGLDPAIEHIETAIKINPDAHFGREIYQLEALRWIQSELGKPQPETLYKWLRQRGPSGPPEDRMVGLAGLIRLGNAWESVDVVGALARAAADDRKTSVAEIGSLRLKELLEDGKYSIVGKKADPHPGHVAGRGASESETNKKVFPKLRENATQWAQHREEFMLRKLEQGMHPDTHPEFWVGYEPVAQLKLPGLSLKGYVSRAPYPAILTGIGIGCAAAAVLFALIRRNGGLLKGA